MNFGRNGPFLVPHGLGSRGKRFLGPVSPPVRLSGGRGTQIRPFEGHFWVLGPPPGAGGRGRGPGAKARAPNPGYAGPVPAGGHLRNPIGIGEDKIQNFVFRAPWAIRDPRGGLPPPTHTPKILKKCENKSKNMFLFQNKFNV